MKVAKDLGGLAAGAATEAAAEGAEGLGHRAAQRPEPRHPSLRSCCPGKSFSFLPLSDKVKQGAILEDWFALLGVA